MKKAIACAVLCSSLAASAAGHSFYVDSIDGTWDDAGTTYLSVDVPITYYLRATNDLGESVKGMTNGVRLYGPTAFQPPISALLEFDGTP